MGTALVEVDAVDELEDWTRVASLQGKDLVRAAGRL
jgi:hypothetical protein